jgi:ketosteroid isomerase-like protein
VAFDHGPSADATVIIRNRSARSSGFYRHNEPVLNAADTDAVMPLYAEDGVFMPPYSASAIGREAVRKAYDAVCSAVRLAVKFNVAEVVEMSVSFL